MGRRPTSLVDRAHVGPNRPLLWWVDDMWVRHSREECMPSFLLIHGCHVGPLILVLASDWSRGVFLGLLMWHCAWAGSPPLVWLPNVHFWPLGLLVLGLGIYALNNMLVTCSFGPNSPTHIL